MLESLISRAFGAYKLQVKIITLQGFYMKCNILQCVHVVQYFLAHALRALIKLLENHPNFRKPSISAQFSKCILFVLCFLQGQRNGLAKFQLPKLRSVGNAALDSRTSK